MRNAHGCYLCACKILFPLVVGGHHLVCEGAAGNAHVGGDECHVFVVRVKKYCVGSIVGKQFGKAVVSLLLNVHGFPQVGISADKDVLGVLGENRNAVVYAAASVVHVNKGASSGKNGAECLSGIVGKVEVEQFAFSVNCRCINVLRIGRGDCQFDPVCVIRNHAGSADCREVLRA